MSVYSCKHGNQRKSPQFVSLLHKKCEEPLNLIEVIFHSIQEINTTSQSVSHQFTVDIQINFNWLISLKAIRFSEQKSLMFIFKMPVILSRTISSTIPYMI